LTATPTHFFRFRKKKNVTSKTDSKKKIADTALTAGVMDRGSWPSSRSAAFHAGGI
jgi:hypothetical protein